MPRVSLSRCLTSVAACLLSGALLVSCTGSSRRTAPSTPPSTSAGPSATATQHASGAPAIGSLLSEDPAHRDIHIDILALVRATPTMWVLRARLTTTGSKSVYPEVDGFDQGYSGGGFANLKLVDLVGGHAARVLQNTNGSCVCSQQTQLNAPRGQTERDVYAAFPALPGGPSTVLLNAPGFGPPVSLPLADPGGRPVEGEPTTNPDQVRPARMSDLVVRAASLDGNQSTISGGKSVSRSIASDVLFAFGKADLTSPARATLTGLSAELRTNAAGQVSVVGHTDSVGSATDNQLLSLQRAQSVAAFLGAQVRPAGLSLVATGRGETEPIADESGPDRVRAAARNRRVTITYQRKSLPKPDPSPSSLPVPTGAPLGTITGSTAGPLTIRVDGLQRVQDRAVLGTFTLTNTGSTPSSILFTFQDRLDAKYVGSAAFSGLSLIDRVAGQRYAVISDSEKGCLCTLTAGGYPPLQPGDTRRLYALFGAPPTRANTVDLDVPSFRNGLKGLPLQ